MQNAFDPSMMRMMLRTMTTMIQTGNMQPPAEMVPIQYNQAQLPARSSTVPATPMPLTPLPIAPRSTASELAVIDDEPRMVIDEADDDDAFGNMEELMKDAAADKKKAAATLKRPAAATMKRPAAATMKRPASATKKPTSATSASTKPEIIYYKDSTIYSSKYKGGYRVLLPGEKRIDKLFLWSAFKSRAEALSHIKGIVDKMST